MRLRSYNKVMNANLNGKENCLIYSRVSTTKQAQQGESHEDQEKICRGIADRENLNVLSVFQEQYSGRKDARPVFGEMLAYIKKNPRKVSVVIFRSIDRLTRNGTVGYEILKKQLSDLGVRVIDGHGIIQKPKNTLEHLGIEFSWSKTNPSETTELIMAQHGKGEVTQILTRMIGAEIVLVRDGYKVRGSVDGFSNKKVFIEGKKKVIQIPDLERCEYFVKMFEMRASTAYSDQEIVDHINAMGYRSRVWNRWSKNRTKVIGVRGGISLTIKQLQEVIKRPIYCGVNNEKWLTEPIKTKYSGLVSIDTFNKANRGKVYVEECKDGSIKIRENYNLHSLKRRKDNPLFPFKEMVRCPLCSKPFLGSSPRGRSGQSFPTYHCCRGHKYYGVPKSDFEKSLTEFVNTLRYKDGFMESFKATLMNKFREREKEVGQVAVKVGASVSELELEKQQKIDAFTSTTNSIIRESLEKQINELHEQITEKQNQRNKMEIQENDIHTFVAHAKTLMEHPEEMLLNQDDLGASRALYTLVFDKIPTHDEILNGTPKLSLTYKLSEEFNNNKSDYVRLDGIEWNTIENTVRTWNEVFAGLEGRLAFA